MQYGHSHITAGKTTSYQKQPLNKMHRQKNNYYHYYTRLTASFFRTTWVSQYQKGKTSLDLNEARDDGSRDGSGISWTCTSLQTDNHTNTSIFTGRMLFQPTVSMQEKNN